MGARAVALFAGLLSGLSIATETFAYIAHLDRVLGAPWYRLGFLAFYPPWGILVWAWQWGGRVPAAFRWPALLGSILGALTVYSAWPRRSQTTQPQAHWATWQELQQADVLGLPGTGVVLGQLWRWGWWWWRRITLRATGSWHLLVVAGTRSGKTSSIVLPTLLEYQGSCLIHDPKGGLYAQTAGYRQTLGKVVLLAPMEEATDQYNPWDAVRVGTDDEMRDVDLITHYLTHPDGEPIYDNTSKHFADLVQQFFRGVSLYGLHTGLATNGAAFDELVNHTDWDDLLTVMRASSHPIIHRAAVIASRPGDKELGSLQTTMARALDIFVDPRVAHMTETSTFQLADFRDAEQPCSVYLVVPFSDQDRLRSLVGVLLQILIDHCTGRLLGWKHPVLALIEEYPSLGRMKPLSRALNYAGEYALRFCLVTPSLEALVDVYGAHHNHLEGCRIQAVFGLSDAAVAKQFSQRAGTRERTRDRITYQSRGGHSTTEDVKDEPLLNTTGFLDLGERDVALFAGRSKRVVSQARYYEHEPWRSRSQIPLAVLDKEELCGESA